MEFANCIYLALVVLLLASCARDTSPTLPTPVTVVKPTVGSSFKDEFSADNTLAIITATHDTMVRTVLRTDGVMLREQA